MINTIKNYTQQKFNIGLIKGFVNILPTDSLTDGDLYILNTDKTINVWYKNVWDKKSAQIGMFGIFITDGKFYRYFNNVWSVISDLDYINTELAKKVDVEIGKSLVSDTEIARLANVNNYDDTNVQTHIANTDIHITTTDKTSWNSKANGIHKHTVSDITDLPNIPIITNDLTNELKSKYDTAYLNNHTHNNKTILDNLNQDVINNSHIHTNKSQLDKINEDSNGNLTYNGNTINANSNWNSVNNKPFESLDTNTLAVTNGVLSVIGGGGTSAVSSVNGKTGVVIINASDVGALSNTTKIPTKTSELVNDSGYITTIPSDYVTENEMSAALSTKIGTSNIKAGSNISVNIVGNDITITSTGGGGTGGTTDYTALSNKPTINTVELIGNKTSAELGIASAEHSHTVSNISDFPTSLPASDVSEWAKSPTKPTYTASEVGALPNTTTIPTKTSQLTNDSNFVADNTYVHTDNNFTSVLKSSYDNAVTNSHSHSNKAILDSTTASYTTEEKTKLSGLDNYTLPTASTTVKGGIKVDGTSIVVDENGVASASESGGGLTEADVFAICEAGVTTLGNQITTISWYMSRAYIPSSVISMGSSWLRAAIATYKINGGEHLTTVGYNFAYGCTALTSISLPALTTVGDSFANSCTALKTISLPALTTGSSSFAAGCTALKTISLPALTTGSSSFASGCTALTTISLPVLTTVGAYFAYSCPLTHLVVGDASTLTLTSTSGNTYTMWKLPVEDMVAFGRALTTATSTTALTFGATYWNALSAAQKAIFTNKNYTVSTA